MSNKKELVFGAGLWMFGQFVDRYATDAYGRVAIRYGSRALRNSLLAANELSSRLRMWRNWKGN